MVLCADLLAWPLVFGRGLRSRVSLLVGRPSQGDGGKRGFGGGGGLNPPANMFGCEGGKRAGTMPAAKWGVGRRSAGLALNGNGGEIGGINAGAKRGTPIAWRWR